MTIDYYLDILNAEQRMAVEDKGTSTLTLGAAGSERILQKPCSGAILAGAGSGKTRVITTKIAYLIAKGVLPYKILAVTFTKKAANEMRERAVIMEERAQDAQIRTFHSWGANFLRHFAHRGGLNPHFTVYDDDDMVSLVHSVLPALTKKEAAVVAHKIALAKDYGITPESTDFSAALQAGLEELCDTVFLEQYASYQKELRKIGNVDFGDLILLPYLMIKNDELLRQEMHIRHQFILVDEFQDSNVAQLLLLKELAGVNENPPANVYVCAVGDEDQSIYRFRGAEVGNLLHFEDEFPNANVISLVTNYRSTPEILECANNVIAHNSERHKKELKAATPGGKLPTLVFLPNQDDETQFCADLIQNAHKKGVPYSDWAILYRTNAQSLGFETDFLRRKIPYSVVGSLKFYEREEIKDALSWLSFLANPMDEIAFRRIVNKPVRGVGSATQEKIIANTRPSLEERPSLLTGSEDIKLSKKAKEGLSAFKKIVSELEQMLAVHEHQQEENLSSFIEALIKKSELEDFYKAQDEISGTQKLANLQELVNSALLYPCTQEGLLAFLDSIELDRAIEEQAEDGEEKTDRVTLITLHTTKGLEFSRVIITGLEYGVFPRENKTGRDLEEERRLFYVGITRARQELYFTSCALRRLYGKTSAMRESPFLSELGKNIRILGQKPALFSSAQEDATLSAKSPLAKKWERGRRVYHDDWGYGQIVHADFSDTGELVIKVQFENGGTKMFLPQYQKHLTLSE